jgi:hypothetical protein
MNYEIKRELRNIISGNEPIRQNSLIQSITDHLRRSKETSRNAQKGEFTKQEEAEYLIKYITDTSLWIKNLENYIYLSEGAEQKVYLSKDVNHVLKLNTSIFYEFWMDYFHSLLFHNYFFTSTTYELVGFCYNDLKELCTVVKQNYVKADSLTELENVKRFLNNNNFFIKKNNDYYNSDLGLILEDLHDENVLTSKETLFFIDTVFYIMPSFFE